MALIYIPGSLDEVIDKLIQYRKEKKEVETIFNGHILYSRNVTPDSGYLEVTGYTRDEYRNAKKRQHEDWLKNRLDEEKAAKAESKEWTAKAKKYIYPERLEEWEKYVDTSVRGIYAGKEVQAALVIMEADDNGMSTSDLKELIKKQNHTGASYYLVLNILIRFYKRGPELIEALGAIKDQKDQRIVNNTKRENAILKHKTVDIPEVFLEGSLKKIVDQLLEFKKAGKSVFCRYNGHILYSDIVTLDSAYIDITGFTYKQFKEAQKEFVNKGIEDKAA